MLGSQPLQGYYLSIKILPNIYWTPLAFWWSIFLSAILVLYSFKSLFLLYHPTLEGKWHIIHLLIHLFADPSIHPISIHYPSIIHPSNIHQSIHSYIQFIYLQMGVWWLWLPTLCISWIHFWSWLNLFILLDDIRVSYAHSSFRLLRYAKHLWWIVRGCGISNLIIPFCQQTTITRKV